MRYLNPFWISSTYKEHFGSDFSEDIFDTLRGYRLKASLQIKTGDYKFVARSLIYNPLNRHPEKGIFFLATEDGVSKGTVHVLKSDQKREKFKTNLKNGKLFWVDNQFKTAAINLVDRNKKNSKLMGGESYTNKKV